MQIVQIPFAGLYNSLFDSELDSVESRNCENWQEDDEGRGNEPEANARPLDASDYHALVWSAIDWSKAHEHVAEKYAAYFDTELSEIAGFETGFKFESMKSPREYNFSTDRVFCFVQDSVMARMYGEIDPLTFEKVIKERFTSRSGFSSFYSNDVADWRAKPIAEYDHNELGTVLLAFIETLKDVSELEETVFERMSDTNVFDTAFDNAMDYGKFEEEREEKREEKHGAIVEYAATFCVLVGNLGTVCETTDEGQANASYAAYCKLVQEAHGRASGEAVTLMKDGEIVKEQPAKPDEE